MENESELSPAEQKVLRDIRTNGWHVITVGAEDDSPGWAFSIGLFETYKQPEILLFGLRSQTMHQLINQIAEQMQEGTKYADGFRDDSLLEGYGCQFKQVAERWYPETVGFARWFYGETEFPLLQLYWPDKNGRFPWDRRCDAGVRALQPRLHLEDAAEAGAEWLVE
ncbi:MAG TPA: DUF4262 domain-containing protein [Thermoanaerobaculia bacterium]|nr:DUF4262 domain-containing protein [Thermoanaerobaculia bacterium]